MKQIYFFAFLFSLPFISISQDRESDSLALVSIYQSLDGDNWPTNDNWLSDMPLEEWRGINTTNNRVTKLEIKPGGGAGISGTFPLQALELSELSTLELSNISMNESIPESLVQLTKLNRIVFKYCNLNGDLPQIFDQFSNLKTLVLSFNEITGPLPALPQDMSLAYIDRNQFTGEIPESWAGNLMTNLQIHGNNLTGNYDIISTMPNISSMILSDNDWDDHTFPLWIDDIPNLDRFSCDGCNIKGEIPAELDFSNSENYSGMFISNNDLSGDISILFNNPDYEKEMFLRARSNSFTGELPVHLISSFHELDVYDNHYSSMTEPQENVEYTLDILFNDFTYKGLVPVQQYIALDSIIGVKYWNQNTIGSNDTITITTQTNIILDAGDDDPNTTYQWYTSNQKIEGETSQELSINISENNQSGSYRCHLENPDFPELSLKTGYTILDVDISTSAQNINLEEIKISPNPANNLLSIEGIDSNEFDYSINTLSGNTIIEGKSDKKIDVSHFDSGVYILSIFINNSIKNQKFIKL